MKPPSSRLWRTPANRCVVSSGDLLLRYPITGIAGCCARAPSGHAAAPPMSVMNARRFIRLPTSRVGWVSLASGCDQRPEFFGEGFDVIVGEHLDALFGSVAVGMKDFSNRGR